MLNSLIFALMVSCIFSDQTYKCVDGEYADDSDPKKCKSCPEHCVTCTSLLACTSCFDRYFLYTADNTCELKTLITTLNCIDIGDKTLAPTVCSKCADGYWLKDDSTCSVVTLTTCKTWQSGVAAEACQTYAYNCTNIHENCILCSSNIVCTGCAEGYFLASNSVCQEKTGSCLTWKQSTIEECDTCPDGYNITNTKYCYASQCLFSENNSISCGNGKTRSSAPFCNISCSDSHCNDCSNENSDACLECTSGYLVSVGQCVEQTGALENCTHANTTNTLRCETCKSGFTTLSDGTCQVNLEYCAKMADASSCQTCEDGYYWNSGTPACTLCNTNCLCTDDTAMCTGCVNKFFYDDSTVGSENCNASCSDINCLVCLPVDNCTTCESGYGIESNWTCTKCQDTHCTACGSEGKTCTECQQGYYLDSTESAIEAICVECSNENAKYIETFCTITQRINFPWTCADLIGNCAENNPTPLIGESSQSCKVCSPEYYLEANGTCTQCPDNCYNCDDNVAECQECNFGYYVNTSNLCSACDLTCQKCSSSECLDCVDKNAFSTDNASICVECLDNCDRCDDNETCIKCSSGYYLNESSCVACSINCTDCDSSQCYTCLSGNYLDGTECQECPTICLECSDADTCTSCKDEYFLNGTECLNCLENCKVCQNSTNCTACNDNYQLNENNNTCTIFSGKECFDSITGCIKCDASISTICALCEFGSVPINGQCTCESGKILFEAQCIEQVDLPENFSSASLDTLATYLDKAFEDNETKANNTLNILTKIDTILNADGGNTDSNAQKSLQILLYSANTATKTEAKNLYSTILQTVCGIETLTEPNYYIAFAAADKFMTIATDKKAIYQLGFSTCVINLLKNVAPISDISLMKMTNSEFIMQKFTKADINKTFELTEVSIKATEDFMSKVGDDTVYAAVQEIVNTANPYASEQTNEDIILSSKIVSFSVMTGGASAAVKSITLSENSTFPITFDKTGVTGRCGYYDATNKKWTKDGTLNDKTCQFSHLTNFVIFIDNTEKCFDTINGCIKCLNKTTCQVCEFGTAKSGQCDCLDEKKLINGECVTQITDSVDFTALSDKTLDNLASYLTKALESDSKNNTLQILNQAKSILSNEKNDTNAGKSLSLLLQLADISLKEEESQTIYSEILSTICSISSLSEINFYNSFLTADKFYNTVTKSGLKKEIYDLGFSTCLINLLKNIDSISDISLMKLANSEFQMMKFTNEDVDTIIELTDIQITLTKDLLDAVEDGEYYAVVQAINKDANPYIEEQTNSQDLSLSSKIVVFSVFSSGENAKTQIIKLADDKVYPIVFDTGTEIATCGYYNENDKIWTVDGTIDSTKKICSFNHATSFAIFQIAKECFKTIEGCIKCKDDTNCAVCEFGDATISGKCTCLDEQKLIAGECIEQITKETETIEFAELSEKSLDNLKQYITQALESDATTNTKSILSQIDSILREDLTDTNAAVSLGLLTQLADTATKEDSQKLYFEILQNICKFSDLSENNFYTAFSAADKFYKKATISGLKKQIYELGFSTCLTNLLKTTDFSGISLMQLTNSELTMVKFSNSDIDKTIELTDISITMNDDLLSSIGEGEYYASLQAINNNANPYIEEQSNSGDFNFSSKIVSFSVMESGENAGAKTIKLEDDKVFSITFDEIGSSESSCGYYDTDLQKWTANGTFDDAKVLCQFSHLSTFAIFNENPKATDSEESAIILQTLTSLVLLVLLLYLN